MTHATLPPAVVATLPEGSLDPEFVLDVGGEALPAEVVTRWASDGRVMFNSYGPSETTVNAAVWRCDPESVAAARCRSAPRSPTPVCTWWMTPCGPFRRAWWASCTCPEPGWPGGIWGSRG
ncbi:hypothetical protein [Actinomadura madurae]|uniref:hypothetical protein n=1 Tax=Actinomadura madurae TaxID=1993 RepID=UPI0035579573